nr:pectin acetylesterase 8-like [Ipomoea batatas]GMC58616.1 pectin acetylesterase 8-like [Ipomoea batatas]
MKNFGEILLILIVTSLALLNACNDNLVNPTFVKDTSAVCLAGNPAAYYYSKGFGEGVNNWIVYLREGGWCMNVTDCNGYIKRKGVATNPKPVALQNLLSNQKEKNPDFFNWNRVDIRYCDASSFTGNSEIVENDTKLYFRGAKIFNAVIQELLDNGMGSAQNIQYTMVSTEFDVCAIWRNCSLDQIKIMQELRAELLSVLPDHHNSKKGILITSQYGHTQALSPSWNSQAAGTGETIEKLFRDWYFDIKAVHVIDQNKCPYYNCLLN